MNRLLFAASLLATGASLAPVVETEFGKVSGKVDRETGTEYFWGIPFAAPPVGDLRFSRPVNPQPWNNTKRTTDLRPSACPQLDLENRVFWGKEDCLTLDVYKPTAAANLPVLVWIYGGGFTIGNSDQIGLYNGKYLAKNHSVIVVAINYRLGNLGFLALDSLKASQGFAGNYGLLDQQFALKWVQNNIGLFGGDKNRVQIFGQSAGGCSVVAQLAMPNSKGLFHSAIAESPLAVSDVSWLSLKNSTRFGEIYSEQMNCSIGGSGSPEAQIKCLRKKSLGELVEPFFEWRHDVPAPERGELPRLMPIMPWWPTIDGVTLPQTPIELARIGKLHDVPTVIGTVHDEGTIFVPLVPFAINGGDFPVVFPLTEEGYTRTLNHFFNETLSDNVKMFYGTGMSPTKRADTVLRDALFACPARAILRAITENPSRKSPAWTYQFDHVINTDMYRFFGDYHTSEITYVFDHPRDNWNASDTEMARVMSSFWTSLARDQRPSCTNCPEWTPYSFDAATDTDSYMRFGQGTAMQTNLLKVFCDFWDKWGYVNNP